VSPTVLQANLRALAQRSPALAARLAEAAAAPDARVELARNGDAVPVVTRDGREWALHSRYDPRAEAARLAHAVPRASYAVVYGLGAAHHLRALISSAGVTGALVVEPDPALVRLVLQVVPLDDLLADPRIDLAVGIPASQLPGHLLVAYLPLLDGPLAQVPLDARVRLDPQYFAQATAVIALAARASADDMAVQARFGRRWFVNIVGNLPHLAPARPWPRIGPRAAVIAAGPSLDGRAALLGRLAAGGTTLIATDTALPALVQYGLPPTVVISIDCQHVGYHHFLGRLPRQSSVVLDIGSPPMLARRAGEPLFVTGAHPLGALIAAGLAPLPVLDFSGGNVTHAAVSLAAFLGAREVEVLAADFSYPRGAPYARGTYFFPHFLGRASRLAPADSALVGFVLSDSDLRPVPSAEGLRYRSSRLDSYRAAFADRFGSLEEIEAGRFVCRPRPPAAPPVDVNSPRASWPVWLRRYHGGLLGLAGTADTAAASWRKLAAEPRTLWTTLLPAAAATAGATAAERLEKARLWCCETIQKRL
jgi:hypothetical protein